MAGRRIYREATERESCHGQCAFTSLGAFSEASFTACTHLFFCIASHFDFVQHVSFPRVFLYDFLHLFRWLIVYIFVPIADRLHPHTYSPTYSQFSHIFACSLYILVRFCEFNRRRDS